MSAAASSELRCTNPDLSHRGAELRIVCPTHGECVRFQGDQIRQAVVAEGGAGATVRLWTERSASWMRSISPDVQRRKSSIHVEPMQFGERGVYAKTSLLLQTCGGVQLQHDRFRRPLALRCNCVLPGAWMYIITELVDSTRELDRVEISIDELRSHGFEVSVKLPQSCGTLSLEDLRERDGDFNAKHIKEACSKWNMHPSLERPSWSELVKAFAAASALWAAWDSLHAKQLHVGLLATLMNVTFDDVLPELDDTCRPFVVNTMVKIAKSKYKAGKKRRIRCVKESLSRHVCALHRDDDGQSREFAERVQNAYNSKAKVSGKSVAVVHKSIEAAKQVAGDLELAIGDEDDAFFVLHNELADATKFPHLPLSMRAQSLVMTYLHETGDEADVSDLWERVCVPDPDGESWFACTSPSFDNVLEWVVEFGPRDDHVLQRLLQGMTSKFVQTSSRWCRFLTFRAPQSKNSRGMLATIDLHGMKGSTYAFMPVALMCHFLAESDLNVRHIVVTGKGDGQRLNDIEHALDAPEMDGVFRWESGHGIAADAGVQVRRMCSPDLVWAAYARWARAYQAERRESVPQG